MGRGCVVSTDLTASEDFMNLNRSESVERTRVDCLPIVLRYISMVLMNS